MAPDERSGPQVTSPESRPEDQARKAKSLARLYHGIGNFNVQLAERVAA